MAAGRGMSHGEVCSTLRGLEKSPSKTQGNSSLSSAHGDLSKGRTKAKSGGHAAGKRVSPKLGSAKQIS